MKSFYISCSYINWTRQTVLSINIKAAKKNDSIFIVCKFQRYPSLC